MSSHEARFWQKVTEGQLPEAHPELGQCWIWTAGRYPSGYGKFTYERRTVLPHRYVYELMVGVIPAGLQLDHLCRNRSCVNPDHLDPVTPRVNSLRSESPAANAVRLNRCVNGHEFTPANTYRRYDGGRNCRECGLANNRRRYRRLKELAN